jgi:hypothetical protein
MRDHQWQPAEGTIVDAQSRHHEHHYTIEVTNSDGLQIQRTIKHRSPSAYPVGARVRVEVSRTNEVRFDPNAPGGDPLIGTMSMSDQIQQASAAFDGPGVGGPDFGPSFGTFGSGGTVFGPGAGASGGIGGIFGDLAGTFGAMSGGMTAQVIGPGGRQLPFDPAEVSQLTQAIMSGDPAARQAAIQRLHEIRAAALGGMTGQRPDPGAMGPGAGFGGSSLDQGASGFNQGGNFDQGASFNSSPASGGSGADDHGTVPERLARLQQLLSQGVLTQSEYDTQRQRIIEGI